MKPEFRIQNSDNSSHFAEQGFEILADILSSKECDALTKALSEIYERGKKTAKKKIGGIRNLLWQCSQVFELAESDRLKQILEYRLGTSAFPIRALFFDKTPEANWRVPWHQDLTIAVVEKLEIAGFKAWSRKNDVLHVQPPFDILEGMAIVRIHLDACDSNNGPLKIIPRSHLHGKLGASEISERTIERDVLVCEMPKGGALVMRPLLLHSSSPAKFPSHRRVLHIEYSTQILPGGLKWFGP